MQSKSEKTSSMMGIVVSVLLHGIFFAGCIALDYSVPSTDQTETTTEISTPSDHVTDQKSKS